MNRTSLPPIQPPYDTNPRYYSTRSVSPGRRELYSHGPRKVQEQEYRGPSRLDMLEERLAQQERNTQSMIERAVKIKEDVIDSLNFTHGTWQEEKHARSMLQEHIRTITAIVNKLNHDIATLESALQSRDSASIGINNAVKNLEVHHVASLTDIRGRIVRCDTSISKLSSDLRTVMESVKQVIKEHQDTQSKIVDRIHGLESKVVSVTSQLDRFTNEQKIKLQHMESDSNQQMAMMEERNKSLSDELRTSMISFQASATTDREKMEERLLNMLHKSVEVQDTMMGKLERKVDESHYTTDAKLHKMEAVLQEEQAKLSQMQNHIENKVLTQLDMSIRQQQDDVNKLKRDCREGFSTVHESISNMKTVVEGKRKLLEEQLRREIGQIRKMVVLV